MSDLHYNRLKDEASAYLKQHKDNPVHWYPYGPEALERARAEDLPIFLSIGYSACHWCHVMAHESFDDQEVADFLNQHFVCIKVDREELPDIDHYYQQACQLFTRSGGWPLSAFLLPDTRPFFVGTYFPPDSRAGATSFMQLVTELNRAYTEEKDNVLKNATEVTRAIAEGLVPNEKVQYEGHFPAPMAIMEAISSYKDKENGGYGSAPKFPQFSFYEWAIDQLLEGMITREEGEHIVTSMERMLMGGIFDQARGGIHRYSVDEKWRLPHFEKMIYDQAGLLKTCSKLSLIYQSPLVFDALMSTLDYLEKEMLSQDGYYFTSQDADSEGREGLYFVYSMEEFLEALKTSNVPELNSNKEKLARWFDLSPDGNFENGLNVLSLNPKFKNEYYTREGWDLIREARKAVAADRKTRIPPATDSKGVGSWNFMLISSFTDVMQYCRIDAIKHRAASLLNRSLEPVFKTFIKSTESEAMNIAHTTTRTLHPPYAEDYVTFADVMLRVYEVTGNEIFKNNFRESMNFICQTFVDGPKLFTRPKESGEHEAYPNQPLSSLDSSYRSPLATFLLLTYRGSVLFQDKEWLEQTAKLKEEALHECLKNPLGAGEALRALTYPESVFKVVKIPKSWLQKIEFANFLPYFLSRFVMCYSSDQDDSWQICSLETCEIQGEGLESFIATLTPPREEDVPHDGDA